MDVAIENVSAAGYSVWLLAGIIVAIVVGVWIPNEPEQ